ncbi:MAG: SdpI family protein, partial [Candidatus Diapherotrites archaeon]|nr:SdpI family protein [Candidatus Diapherotrites archaeon]
LVILSFIIAFIVIPLMPSIIPTHWGAQGTADGFGEPVTMYLFPIIMLGTLILFLVIPFFEPFKKNLKEFEPQFWSASLLIQGFFFLFYLGIIYVILFNELNMNLIVIPLISLLFIGLGYLMPSFKRNFFVGIRTPWTLANEEVWTKTHKFGGKIFIAAGILSLASIFFGIYFLLAVLLFASFSTVIYSFIEFKKMNKTEL